MTIGTLSQVPQPAESEPGKTQPASATERDQADLFDHAPAALFSVNLNGDVLSHNARASEWLEFRGTDHDLRGRNLTEWLTPASRLLYETKLMPQLMETGMLREVVLEIVDSDNTVHQMLVNANLEGTVDGNRVVYVVVVDAKSRLSFEQELIASRRVADIAHRRLAVLHEATSRLTLAKGLDDLGAALLATAGQASLSTWTVVRLSCPADPSGQRVYGELPAAPPHSLGFSSVEQTVCRNPADIATQFPLVADTLRSAGVEAISVTPLLRSDDSDDSHPAIVIGEIICASRRPRSMDEDELETLRALAAQAERVIEHLRLQELLRHQALHDAVTGLANRVLFTERLTQMISSTTRAEDACVVCFLDLDGFKAVNDRFGHAAGDAVLRRVAARLRAVCRTEDVVSRFGGDEFAIAAVGLSPQDAVLFAERVRESTRLSVPEEGHGLTLSSSVGVLHWTPNSSLRAPSATELIAAADAAMYAAKRGGKDAVTLHNWRA